jgi:hypothetical protein
VQVKSKKAGFLRRMLSRFCKKLVGLVSQKGLFAV